MAVRVRKLENETATFPKVRQLENDVGSIALDYHKRCRMCEKDMQASALDVSRKARKIKIH
jgi:hypothetical protein